jgi:hypothetical protein
MATSQQIKANRENARRSTGPRTPRGKAKSSQNALKHGLCAKTVTLPGENIGDFQTLLTEFESEFQPVGALEQLLLRQLADIGWRLRRVPLLEAALWSARVQNCRDSYESYPGDSPDEAVDDLYLLGAALIDDTKGDILSRLSRYESRLSHHFYRTLEQLRQAQDRRRSSSSRQDLTRNAPPEAQAPGEPAPSAQTNPIPGGMPAEYGASAAQPTGILCLKGPQLCPTTTSQTRVGWSRGRSSEWFLGGRPRTCLALC